MLAMSAIPISIPMQHKRHAQTQHSDISMPDNDNILLCKASLFLPIIYNSHASNSTQKLKAEKAELTSSHDKDQCLVKLRSQEKQEQNNSLEENADKLLCTTTSIRESSASPQCVWFYDVQLSESSIPANAMWLVEGGSRGMVGERGK